MQRPKASTWWIIGAIVLLAVILWIITAQGLWNLPAPTPSDAPTSTVTGAAPSGSSSLPHRVD